ncbi:MAG: DUF427 domain-containing protein [Chloroflexi bacterium]|nr:DUF427 domain-containing protein [Chloroflexota bacterium]
MNRRTITIRDNFSGKMLATAEENGGVQLFEGAWYFDRDAVDMSNLTITDRTYICPYKGVCYWIDLDMPGHQATNIGFTYFEVKSGYEFIQHKIGLYAGKREATEQTATEGGIQNAECGMRNTKHGGDR